MAGFPRNIAARRNAVRNAARKQHKHGQAQQHVQRDCLDRGASIPTREMKLQIATLRTVLAMPTGALGAQDTDVVRANMQKRLAFYTDILVERDRLANGEIDPQELRRRTNVLCRSHGV